MIHRGYFRLVLVLIELVLVASVVLARSAAPVVAQSSGAFDLTRSTVDGGGGNSSGGGYALSGTMGQPDAGSLSGGTYQLDGGFWVGTSINNYTVYLPLVKK